MFLNHPHNFVHIRNSNWHTCFVDPAIGNLEEISIPYGLTQSGFKLPSTIKKRKESDNDMYVDLHRKLLEKNMFDFKSVERVRAVIKAFFIKKDRFCKTTSYGLKHYVERFLQRTFDDHSKGYVANGDFILAMALENYQYRRHSDTDPNCTFKLSEDCIELLGKSELAVSIQSIELFQQEGLFLV